MNYIKNFFKAILISFIVLFIMSVLTTLFSYFNILSYKLTKIILKTSIYISLFIGSFILGKTIKSKAWIEGIKFSLVYILIFLILNGFSLIKVIYYISFMICSVLGAILGINTKKGD